MKKFFLKIYIVLLTVLININILYRLVGYVVFFLEANNIYICQNAALNRILDILYSEEKSIVFIFISAFCFIVFAVLSLFLYGIASKKERAVYTLCALIPFVIPQFIPYAIPLFVWNIIWVVGSITLLTYFIYLIHFCVSVIKR